VLISWNLLSHPGLIAQIKGTPTRDRYHIATIFVDHSSDQLPSEVFTSSHVIDHPWHANGPIYVLSNKLQAGHHLSKWQARSRMAIFIGPSINHASGVGLALNLNTGLVSPVFHAKYDKKFGQYMIVMDHTYQNIDGK
jgi:hypothetical protein